MGDPKDGDDYFKYFGKGDETGAAAAAAAGGDQYEEEDSKPPAKAPFAVTASTGTFGDDYEAKIKRKLAAEEANTKQGAAAVAVGAHQEGEEHLVNDRTAQRIKAKEAEQHAPAAGSNRNVGATSVQPPPQPQIQVAHMQQAVSQPGSQAATAAAAANGTRRPAKKHDKKLVMGMVGLALLAVIVVVVAVVVAVTTSGGAAPEPTPAPTFPPFAFSSSVLANPPEVTLEALQADPVHSPQAKAYYWMLNDPNLPSYDEPRKEQRFAIAALYYAFFMLDEETAGQWLSYDIPECMWMLPGVGGTAVESTFKCTEDGQIQWLTFPSQELPENTGVFAPEIFLMLPFLQSIRLSDHDLQGTLQDYLPAVPTGWSATTSEDTIVVPSLTTIDYSNSKVHGSIPDQLTRMSTLETLFLTQNQLTGTIPVLSPMRALDQLDLSYNQLRGTVPVGLSHIDEIFLNGNRLTGKVPEATCRASVIMVDCDKVECPCVPVGDDITCNCS